MPEEQLLVSSPVRILWVGPAVGKRDPERLGETLAAAFWTWSSVFQ